MVIFNSSVWFERCIFFAFNGITTADQTADRFSRAAILNWRLHCHVPKKPKSKSEFGSAGRRTSAQGEAARTLAHNTITAIDHDHTIVAYTDGASKGNPGPCGAGAIITYPNWGHRAGKHTEELSAGLGRGTNQLGELWAIGMVLEDTAAKIRDGYTPPPPSTALFSLTVNTPKAASRAAGVRRAPTRPSWRASGLSWRPVQSNGLLNGSPGTPT